MPVPIEITILGSGSAIPTPRRMQPAILFKYEGDYILFDCGESAQLSLQKVNISPIKIKRIFITHWHADHFGGLIPLIETLHMLGRKEPLEIYGPEAEWFVDKILELSYWRFGFDIKARDVSVERKEKIVEEEKYEIYSFPVKHSVPSVGYIFCEKEHWKIIPSKAKKFGLYGEQLQLIKKKGSLVVNGKKVMISEIAKRIPGRIVAYSGDTLPVEEFFANASNGLMIHDATFVEEIDGRMHSSFTEVCALAKKYGIKKLVLTHFSRRYTNEKELREKAKKLFRNSVIARDGMKIKW